MGTATSGPRIDAQGEGRRTGIGGGEEGEKGDEEEEEAVGAHRVVWARSPLLLRQVIFPEGFERGGLNVFFRDHLES